jgi:trans-aconitate methyltransferase
MRNCPSCGNKYKQVLFHQVFEGSEYDVVMCDRCGFAYADGDLEQSYLNAYYTNQSKYEHAEQTDFEIYQFPDLAQMIAAHFPYRNARILEIGCANGGLLNELKKNGYRRIAGLDPSPACAINAEKEYDIPVMIGTVDTADISCQFDLIVIIAVLEHIADLKTALFKVLNLLAPDGRVFVEVPDATKFRLDSSPYAPFMEFSTEHINYFSTTSLVKLMASSGYSAVQLEKKAYDKQTNVIRAVFEREQTEEILAKYVDESMLAEAHVIDILDRLNTPFIVWGAGSLTRRLSITGHMDKVAFFIDQNPNYHELNGKPVVRPAKLTDGGTVPIVIASRVFQDEIVKQIHDMRLKNKIITLFEE